MASKRETAMAALAALLLETGVEVWRHTDLARAIPSTGLIELREGDAVATPLLSPIGFDVEQDAEILVMVSSDDEPTRDAALDALVSQIHALLIADRTLGGAVDDSQLGAPSFDALEADGAGKVARLSCTLSYFTLGTPNG